MPRWQHPSVGAGGGAIGAIKILVCDLAVSQPIHSACMHACIPYDRMTSHDIPMLHTDVHA